MPPRPSLPLGSASEPARITRLQLTSGRRLSVSVMTFTPLTAVSTPFSNALAAGTSASGGCAGYPFGNEIARGVIGLSDGTTPALAVSLAFAAACVEDV